MPCHVMPCHDIIYTPFSVVSRGDATGVGQVFGPHGATQIEIIRHFLDSVDDRGMILVVGSFAVTVAVAGAATGSRFILIIR